jgi:hypothetical protein
LDDGSLPSSDCVKEQFKNKLNKSSIPKKGRKNDSKKRNDKNFTNILEN